MAGLYLPTRASSKSDVETCMRLLEPYSSKYDIGLEIIGNAADFLSEKGLDKIRENMQEVPYDLVVHGFSGIDVYLTEVCDLRTPKGAQNLRNLISLAEDVGANYVHTHSGAGYRGNISPSLKDTGLAAIRANMLNMPSSVPLGIENLPNPSMGDRQLKPDEIWKDCVDSVKDCWQIVMGTEMKITFDTCHYACGLQNFDLIDGIKDLGKNLNFLHISDVIGYWEPNKSLWTEGVIPGEGRIGNQFEKFFSYVRENYPKIGICVEVDNKDFRDPIESEETLKRVDHWLSS